jgi:hypothetical protein
MWVKHGEPLSRAAVVDGARLKRSDTAVATGRVAIALSSSVRLGRRDALLHAWSLRQL